MADSQVEIISKQITKELSTEAVSRALLATTFKKLDDKSMRQALMEGMIRGFTFENFMKKDVYAVPFAGSYSLVTSIDFSRKIGARSGVVGVDKPIYVMSEDGKAIISCSVTVHKKFADGYVGPFTAEVFFNEYTTNQNLWKTKPRTMIAKVAEMHALRKACPEELAQQYVEEEIELEVAAKDRMSLVKPLVEGGALNMGNFNKNEKNKDQKEPGEDQTADAGRDLREPGEE